MKMGRGAHRRQKVSKSNIESFAMERQSMGTTGGKAFPQHRPGMGVDELLVEEENIKRLVIETEGRSTLAIKARSIDRPIDLL